MVLRLLLALIPTYGNLTRLAALLVGFIFPTFESFKAVESKRADDDKQWLTYWVCYATLTSFEVLAGPFLAWVPLYAVLRVVLLAWLALPQFQGAAFVYEEFVRPFLLVVAEKARELPSLEPYFAGFAPTKDFEALKREATASVAEKIDQAKQQAVSAEPEEDERAAYQPLKAHAQ